MAETPDWTHCREHFERRSQRMGETEQDIHAVWADEAYLDPQAETP